MRLHQYRPAEISKNCASGHSPEIYILHHISESQQKAAPGFAFHMKNTLMNELAQIRLSFARTRFHMADNSAEIMCAKLNYA